MIYLFTWIVITMISRMFRNFNLLAYRLLSTTCEKFVFLRYLSRSYVFVFYSNITFYNLSQYDSIQHTILSIITRHLKKLLNAVM